ncbi:MAG: hypothetical protein AAFN07_06645, partial [Pseudomonadota bacterium]
HAREVVHTDRATDSMKRSHRLWHLWLWLVVTPTIAALLWFGIQSRPDTPVVDSLPPEAMEPS